MADAVWKRARFALLALCLAPGVASSHELSAGAVVLGYRSFYRDSTMPLVLELSDRVSFGTEGLAGALRLTGGLRAGLPDAVVSFPLEVFARLQLVARRGVWGLSVGPELGFSGFARLKPTVLVPPVADVFREEAERLGPLYLAFSVAPLELTLGRLQVSVLEAAFGSTLLTPGVALRYQVLALRVGVAL